MSKQASKGMTIQGDDDCAAVAKTEVAERNLPIDTTPPPKKRPKRARKPPEPKVTLREFLKNHTKEVHRYILFAFEREERLASRKVDTASRYTSRLEEFRTRET